MKNILNFVVAIAVLGKLTYLHSIYEKYNALALIKTFDYQGIYVLPGF